MIIEHASFNDKLIDKQAMNALRSVRIPLCPKIVAKLLDGESPQDLSNVLQLVSSDVALAAYTILLARVSSPGTVNRKWSVSHALSILGSINVLKLVHSLFDNQVLKQNDVVSDMQRFWDHSAYKSVAICMLAPTLSKICAEDAHTFGLFCDVGMAVLGERFNNYWDTVSLARDSWTAFTEVEDERYAINHAVVGAVLAQEWHLPDTVVLAIGHHHNFTILSHPHENTSSDVLDLVAIGLIAEYIVSRFMDAPVEHEWQKHKQTVFDYFGILETDVDELLNTVLPKLFEIQAMRG